MVDAPAVGARRGPKSDVITKFISNGAWDGVLFVGRTIELWTAHAYWAGGGVTGGVGGVGGVTGGVGGVGGDGGVTGGNTGVGGVADGTVGAIVIFISEDGVGATGSLCGGRPGV